MLPQGNSYICGGGEWGTLHVIDIAFYSTVERRAIFIQCMRCIRMFFCFYVRSYCLISFTHFRGTFSLDLSLHPKYHNNITKLWFFVFLLITELSLTLWVLVSWSLLYISSKFLSYSCFICFSSSFWKHNKSWWLILRCIARTRDRLRYSPSCEYRP